MEGIALGDILGLFRRPEGKRRPGLTQEDILTNDEWLKQQRFTDTPNDPQATYMGRDKTRGVIAPIAPQDSTMPKIDIQGQYHDDRMATFNAFSRLSGPKQTQYLMMLQHVNDAVQSGAMHPEQAKQLINKLHDHYMTQYYRTRQDSGNY